MLDLLAFVHGEAARADPAPSRSRTVVQERLDRLRSHSTGHTRSASPPRPSRHSTTCARTSSDCATWPSSRRRSVHREEGARYVKALGTGAGRAGRAERPRRRRRLLPGDGDHRRYRRGSPSAGWRRATTTPCARASRRSRPPRRPSRIGDTAYWSDTGSVDRVGRAPGRRYVRPRLPPVVVSRLLGVGHVRLLVREGRQRHHGGGRAWPSCCREPVPPARRPVRRRPRRARSAGAAGRRALTDWLASPIADATPAPSVVPATDDLAVLPRGSATPMPTVPRWADCATALRLATTSWSTPDAVNPRPLLATAADQSCSSSVRATSHCGERRRHRTTAHRRRARRRARSRTLRGGDGTRDRRARGGRGAVRPRGGARGWTPGCSPGGCHARSGAPVGAPHDRPRRRTVPDSAGWSGG